MIILIKNILYLNYFFFLLKYHEVTFCDSNAFLDAPKSEKIT